MRNSLSFRLKNMEESFEGKYDLYKDKVTLSTLKTSKVAQDRFCERLERTRNNVFCERQLHYQLAIKVSNE